MRTKIKPPLLKAKPSPDKKVGTVSDIFAKTASSKLSVNKPKASAVEERTVSPKRPDEASSPASPDGKKTPEGVIKRHGVGHGGNADLMAQIREKRASMVPKTALPSAGAEDEQLSSPKSEVPKETPTTAPFGNVKLR